MRAGELMIGDYVIRKNVPKEILIVDTIDSIRGIVYLDLDGLGITEKLENIEPIPLTQKILERNGFMKSKNGELTLELDNVLGAIEIVLVSSYDEAYYWWMVNNELITTIKSIHELQHVLRLCRINKEIKL